MEEIDRREAILETANKLSGNDLEEGERYFLSRKLAYLVKVDAGESGETLPVRVLHELAFDKDKMSTAEYVDKIEEYLKAINDYYVEMTELIIDKDDAITDLYKQIKGQKEAEDPGAGRYLLDLEYADQESVEALPVHSKILNVANGDVWERYENFGTSNESWWRRGSKHGSYFRRGKFKSFCDGGVFVVLWRGEGGE